MSVELWEHLPIKKQVIEFTGDNADEIVAWGTGKAYVEADRLLIRTPQGDLAPAIGDYVVRGIENELYPVPRTVFLESYRWVGEGP